MTLKGPDQKIESFLVNIIGCPYRYVPDVPLKKINTSKAGRQFSRLSADNPDYVSGIAETYRLDGYVPPVLLHQRSKESFNPLDGIHRVLGKRALGHDTIAAYVIDVDDDEAEFIATTVNPYLNGQGLSEDERRRHFLAVLHKHVTDLTALNLRDPLVKKSMLLLAIAKDTARRWADVEVLRARVERLGLKLPPAAGEGHKTGDRSDAWILSVARLTDEELQKYWLTLTNAPATAIVRLAKELDRCTSTQKRAAMAEANIPKLNPTLRVMSQTQADKDRRAATQIRSHGAGLLKIAPNFKRLAAKYDDVRTTLEQLGDAIEDMRTSPGMVDGDTKESTTSAS